MDSTIHPLTQRQVLVGAIINLIRHQLLAVVIATPRPLTEPVIIPHQAAIKLRLCRDTMCQIVIQRAQIFRYQPLGEDDNHEKF